MNSSVSTYSEYVVVAGQQHPFKDVVQVVEAVFIFKVLAAIGERERERERAHIQGSELCKFENFVNNSPAFEQFDAFGHVALVKDFVG